MKIKYITKLLWVIAVFCIAWLLGFLLYNNILHDNFHVVIEDELYRSAQMKPAALKRVVEKYHIKTILNLRGENLDEKWYQEEHQLSQQFNLSYYSIPFSAHHLPALAEIQKLIFIFQTAPHPILLHCQGGADRTGMAAAIGVILAGGTATYAKHQASWRYSALSPTSVGYQLLSDYFAWLEMTHKPYGKESFLYWIASEIEGKGKKLAPQWGAYIT